MSYLFTPWRAVLALVAAAALAATLLVVVPAPADAACTGLTSWESHTAWGREDSQWASTCDGLKDYYGKVQDALTDLHKVRIQAYPNGVQFYSKLSSDAWVNYEYNDADSWTTFRLCRVRVADGVTTAYGPWRTNQGF